MRDNELLAFMKARHDIYLKKAAGKPKPWTDDPILQNYRFCNVFRELDTVTIWIRENIREPYADHPNLWFMLAIARQINWPATLQELMDNGCWPTKTWNWEKARKVMLARQARKEQLYTGAYMLNAHGIAPDDPSDKAFFTCKLVLDSVWQDRKKVEHQLHGTLEAAHQAFLPYHGWGRFTAYEVVTDLRHTRYLRGAPDIMTWASAGPGAKRGLNYIHDRPIMDPIKDDQANAEMQQLLKLVSKKWKGPALEMRDIEHSLCEKFKHSRGSSRSKYNGT